MGTQFYNLYICLYTSFLTIFMYFTNRVSAFLSRVNTIYITIVNFTTSTLVWLFTQAFNFIWYFSTNIFSVLHFAFNMVFFLLKLIIATVVLGIVAYIGIIIYHFFNWRHFALQGDFYFGPTPANNPRSIGPRGSSNHSTGNFAPKRPRAG